MTTDPNAHDSQFEKDVGVDKPGIVGARWWHRSLMDESTKVQRRDVLSGLMVAGGALAAISVLGIGIAAVASSGGGGTPEATSLAQRVALDMQRQYGWDFGARGVSLVFDGVAEGPFVRAQLDSLAAVMAPSPKGPNAKHHIPALVESLHAQPTVTLPDPQDGKPRPDAAAFKRLADVLVPVITEPMKAAYKVGEAVARLAGTREGVAVLVDLPGPQAVAFAAGAATRFEPVLLLDNWPHPYGVVPSHLTLAALAYYQPRFTAQKERTTFAPCFVLDRARTAPYAEQSDRFDNRYYARMPALDALAKDGVKTLFYVVATKDDLPEPADLHGPLSPATGIEARALALTDFGADPEVPWGLCYGGSGRTDGTFWEIYAPGATPPLDLEKNLSPLPKDYRFLPRPTMPKPPNYGTVPVVVAASGVILAAALDRSGSMNRFAGGWSG